MWRETCMLTSTPKPTQPLPHCPALVTLTGHGMLAVTGASVCLLGPSSALPPCARTVVLCTRAPRTRRVATGLDRTRAYTGVRCPR
eukprot:scaffold32920_cov129-Isochrysis_galbana.AAC.4